MSERNVILAVLVAIGTLLPMLVLYVGYQGRAGIVHANRAACARSVEDRRSAIKVWRVQRQAALKISRDPFQSKATRVARRREATQLRAEIAHTRARLIDCDRAHPAARFF